MMDPWPARRYLVEMLKKPLIFNAIDSGSGRARAEGDKVKRRVRFRLFSRPSGHRNTRLFKSPPYLPSSAVGILPYL